jgi:hypothetical protein
VGLVGVEADLQVRLEEHMIIRFNLVVGTILLGLSLTSVDAQSPSKTPEVFCNTMQAGALCPTGTVSVLKLSGPKVQQWLDLVETYNDTVEAATKKLKADARNILTPAQMAELDRWMEKGLNPEVNRLLASRSR